MTTRREFLKVVGAGAGCLSVGALPACGPGETGPLAAGNVSALTEGAVIKLENSGVLLGRDAGGVYAMTAICTHLGCDISGAGGVIGAEIQCGTPCGHGSRYDLNGAVTGGPAGRALQHWEVAVDEAGEITVNVGTAVADDVRVAVA